MKLFEREQTAHEYFKHSYKIPAPKPTLPLADENFLSKWNEAAQAADTVKFLSSLFARQLILRGIINISFTQTLAGKLPVIVTDNHDDFSTLAAYLMNREKRALPLTVNAFTIPALTASDAHRIVLLNRVEYSMVNAEKMGLAASVWLEKSHKLRLRHEAAHYETLRIFGGMKNHALDEIIADTLGQIAAFGNFSAERQRLFFGLRGDQCDGRLQFYCKKVMENERHLVYNAVDKFLPTLEEEINSALSQKLSDEEILYKLVSCEIGKNI